MKKILTLGAALTTLAAGASAQFSGGSSNPYSTNYLTFRGGFVLPLDNNLRDINETFFGIGIDYTLDRSLIRGGETYLSADWISDNIRGNSANLFPLLINQRFFLGDPATNATSLTRTYAFIGIGAVILDLRPSQTRLGGRVGLGMELSRELVAEASLFVSDKSDNGNVRSTSLGFYLGYRF